MRRFAEPLFENLTDTCKNTSGKEISVIKLSGNVLMSAKQMAELYSVGVPTICKKLKKISKSSDISEKEASLIIGQRANDGKLYQTRYYDMRIIEEVGKMLKSNEKIII